VRLTTVCEVPPAVTERDVGFNAREKSGEGGGVEEPLPPPPHPEGSARAIWRVMAQRRARTQRERNSLGLVAGRIGFWVNDRTDYTWLSCESNNLGATTLTAIDHNSWYLLREMFDLCGKLFG
jgi:hypothetical protein